MTSGGSCSYTNSEGHFIGSFNRENLHLAMRVNGPMTTIYLGDGTGNGDTSWLAQNNSPVRDYLLKVQFYETMYSYVGINANCELETGTLCPISLKYGKFIMSIMATISSTIQDFSFDNIH